jgi:HEAT repeat protein
MDIRATLADKQLKAKSRVEVIAKMLLDKELPIAELIRVAKGSKDKEKGTCIEALEFATKATPEIACAACLDFVTETLLDDAPRVKWESAKVVANIAHLYPESLADAVKNLLANGEHSGTVVRWSAARALGEIVKLRTRHNRTLIPAIEAFLKRDNEDKAIVKIYQSALKKVKA